MMTRKDTIVVWGVLVTCIVFVICLRIGVWLWSPAATALAPEPPVAASEPTTIRAIRVEEHLSARLLTLYVKTVIPYDKLIINEDGAVVRDRNTGEEFIVIFEEDLPPPAE